jgi:hypothetical protein
MPSIMYICVRGMCLCQFKDAINNVYMC